MKEFIQRLLSDRIIKVLLIIIGILLSSYLIMLVFFQLIPVTSLSIQEKSYIASTIKNIFHTLFFIVTIIVGILTYLQAKETLFNPIRTEIFKLQISEFEKILFFFQNKNETDFVSIFDMNKILLTNATLMFDDFAMAFFKNEIEINEKERKLMKEGFYGAIVSKDFIEDFQKIEYFEKIKKPKKIEITNPALILKKWQNYKYRKIEFTKKYFDQTTKIKELLASPLLPKELKKLIISFDETVHTNLSIVGDVLTEISQELPDKFPNSKSLNEVEFSGIWNIYNKNKMDYEIQATKILDYINKYLRIEKLIEST